jgi:hypothetical protein
MSKKANNAGYDQTKSFGSLLLQLGIMRRLWKRKLFWNFLKDNYSLEFVTSCFKRTT